MSNILRVVVNDAEAPVVPDTSDDAVSPYTGSFTVADSNVGFSNFVLPTASLVLLIMSILIFIATKIRHGKTKSKFKIKTKRLLCISFITGFIFGVAGFFTNIVSDFHNVKAANETLNITSTDTTINVTKENEANYVLAAAEIILNEPTAAGYDLYVYAPNGNKLKPELSTQDENISPVESENSTLSSNTYGITALDDVDIDIEDEIWNPISESIDSPLLVISHTEATATNDKITFYYGVLVDQDLPSGTYTAEIEYKAVPHYYTITFDPGEGTLNDTTRSIVAGTTLGDLPTPTRANYVFDGWYTDPTDGEKITTTTTPTRSITYYAHWTPSTITFAAGDNIEVIIIADSSNNYKPFYATTGTPVIFTQPAVGTKYIVTVVPEANYKLSDWSGDVDGFASTSLLTTTYIVSDAITSNHISLTTTGEPGSYMAMQNLSTADCPTAGANVTDTRDGKSYTISKFGNYCYMLSNLRLDSTTDGTTARVLTSTDSDITPNSDYTAFTMPTINWTSHQQNYYCKAIMTIVNSEYYYNWYAAKANPFDYSNPSNYDCANITNDTKSLGSICPAGWTLPAYDDFMVDFWDNDRSLLTASGNFSSGSQGSVGEFGYLWFGSRYDNYGAYRLYFDGVNSSLVNNTKAWGLPARCLSNL